MKVSFIVESRFNFIQNGLYRPKGDALKERKGNVAGEDRRQMD